TMAANLRLGPLLAQRLLSVIERQVRGCDTESEQRLDASARTLQSRGFRVVRVPWIPGAEDPDSPWPGVSYVNSALVDRTLFVPQLGLDGVEAEWLNELLRELPGGYQVVPVPARFLLLKNGGIHCALAFERAPRPPGHK